MGRCDHLMGLTEAAAKMVEGASILVVEEGRRLYPDGREEPFRRELVESTVRVEETGESYSGIGGPYPLYHYVLPDGRVLTEAIQAEPWSSGPYFFLALQDESGAWVEESLWSKEAVRDA